MTSSRLVLIFLGIIFLIIIILSSNRMIMGLREGIGRILPGRTRVTPTPTKGAPTPTITLAATPTPIVYKTNGGQTKGADVEKIPSTGAAEVAWLLLGGSFVTGYTVRRFTANR